MPHVPDISPSTLPKVHLLEIGPKMPKRSQKTISKPRGNIGSPASGPSRPHPFQGRPRLCALRFRERARILGCPAGKRENTAIWPISAAWTTQWVRLKHIGQLHLRLGLPILGFHCGPQRRSSSRLKLPNPSASTSDALSGHNF